MFILLVGNFPKKIILCLLSFCLFLLFLREGGGCGDGSLGGGGWDC